jgi:hypothetical protein
MVILATPVTLWTVVTRRVGTVKFASYGQQFVGRRHGTESKIKIWGDSPWLHKNVSTHTKTECEWERKWLHYTTPAGTLRISAVWQHSVFMNLIWVSEQNVITSHFTFVWPCIVTNFFLIKPTDALISKIYFCQETLHVSGRGTARNMWSFLTKTNLGN